MTRHESAAWAYDQGRHALAQGDLARALWLLQYAHTTRPQDLELALLIGSVQLRLGDPAAAQTCRALAETHDVREGWFGLAAAAQRMGDPQTAARHLATGLARHAPLRTPGFDEFCTRIARDAGAAGWCALTADGVVTIVVTQTGARPSAALASLQLDRAAPTPFALDPNGMGRVHLGRRLGLHAVLAVRVAGEHLLASPLSISALTRLEGVVTAVDGGLAGWAWFPGDPDLAPELVVSAANGRGAQLAVRVPSDAANQSRRAFRVPADDLAKMANPLAVCGPDQTHLLGSPLSLTLAPVAAAGDARAPDSAPRPGPVDVVIPIYRGMAPTLDCLQSVLASVPKTTRVILVDDASPEPDLIEAVQSLARQGRISLIRHRKNLGFPTAANAGLAAAEGRDLVLLNSDTLVAHDWLDRLRNAAYSAPDIGTVTPLTNAGSLVSYPFADRDNPAPDAAALARLDSLAHAANGTITIEIPTAVGFCMFIRRDCLQCVGPFRTDAFAQGYGEENDFSMRARHLGWRHVASPGVFVAHLASQSFGTANRHLRARNTAVLTQLHPDYPARIADFLAGDALAAARRRLDLKRWHATLDQRQAVILITHDRGGGVQTRVAARCGELRDAGLRPLTVTPQPGAACKVDDGEADYPNLMFRVPDETELLVATLASAQPISIELHHFIDHHPALLSLAQRLNVPLDIVVHDYAWFCPRVSLTGAEHRYCGEPAIAQCEACVAELGHPLGDIGPRELRARSSALFASARKVIVASRDTGARLQRHFPALAPQVSPWEDDASLPPLQRRPRPPGPMRICVAGAIGLHKGYHCLLALCRDAASRALPIEYVLVGYSEDDLPLLQTGAIQITGPFPQGEAAGLIAAQNPLCGFLPTETHETWSYVLSEFWRAGLPVIAFDLGAPAERIRATGRGLLLRPRLPASQINDAFLQWAKDQ